MIERSPALRLAPVRARVALARCGILLGLGLLVAGCAGLPPGAAYPKLPSSALGQPLATKLGAHVAQAVQAHGGLSGFRILPVGVDGFLTRAQMIGAAERSLDLQYYIFHADESGRLLSAALLAAADRGVRVRILIDDGDTKRGDERVIALDAHPNVEVRVFNPFYYRGHWEGLRAAEFLFEHARLDYRMHNKLLVVDNAAALVGGRNIGNQYFQMDPESQFADDDVFAIGPVAGQLSATFDEFWNSAFAIPAAGLIGSHAPAPGLPDLQTSALEHDGVDYGLALASGEPYAGMLAERLPLVWAHARVLSDSPDKKQVKSGAAAGRLIRRAVLDAARATRSELMIVSPYFVPTADELALLGELRERQVRVRVLTNSLESAAELFAHSGYLKLRVPLLEQGVELNEVRSMLSYSQGSGQTAAISSYGNYALHAKLYVFDRQKLFVGSMNFDQRSEHLNTEIGLMIDSPELANQTARRFEAMTEPQNSFVLALHRTPTNATPSLLWQTREKGEMVEYDREPTRRRWHRWLTRWMAWLPIEGEL